MSDIEKARELMNACVVAAARVREIVRNEFPDYAQLAYGSAQHDPTAVPDYIKAVIKEAQKKGRISPAPKEEEGPQD